MKKSVEDKEILKKRTKKNVRIILAIFTFLELCIVLLFVLTGTKIPLGLWIFLIVFLGVIITSGIISFKFREKIIEPKTQNILGFIGVGLAILSFILILISEGKINPFSIIACIAFLVGGIIIIIKSKKQTQIV